MSFLAPLLQVAGADASAAGSIQAGQAQVQTAQANQQIERQNAAQAIAAGQTNAQIDAQQTREQMGAAAAEYGASGVTMSGSPLEVMASLAAKGELTKQLALYQGQIQATADLNRGNLQLAQAKAANQADDIRAGTTVLTGTAQFARNAALMVGNSGGAGTSPADY